MGPKRLGCSPTMRKWLRNWAISGNCEIFHNHSLWMMPNLYPALAVKNTSCKLVVSPRGTLSDTAMARSSTIKRFMWPLLASPVLEAASAFHATSIQEYCDIRRKGFSQPVAILPNGIDVPVPSNSHSPNHSNRRVLFLGRLHPIKGLDNLLRAWASVQDRFTDWELIIAGPEDRGGSLAALKYLANELQLRRYTFVGALYGSAKFSAYRDADVYVLPTLSENFAMTIAEALASGTPVITTKGAPWPGLMTEDAGWWIEIGVEPLVATFSHVLALPREALDAKGRKGREWMKRDFSWSVISAEMIQFYNWLSTGGETPQFVYID